jgi:DNA repair protein RadC
MNISLKAGEKKKMLSAADMYEIMQRILLRENRIDRNREHLWTISLDTANRLLAIELVSMGSVNKTIVEPMEVFSVPLQKRAVKVVVIHNHPSGQIKPSAADKDITDQLIQCGELLHVPVADHLIISEKSYYSFEENGLLAELQSSTKYVPNYILKARLKKELESNAVAKGEEKKARAMAKVMKAEGYSNEDIVRLTGLSKMVVGRMRG